ncbi:carboxylating nicotinate-nucleotide diphosphorylase [Neptunomonas qingdaonensis]|uniref:Probable nicotinate-nucleotide pyrophosphorylase [carboxylating] n=1 Tax=Neptunomonas qingdaonensis TaxID=1045558 RepID=A0A1I2TJ81_9GAMM|nr:carboxylating nicotinate-nucleotide diphosphorylase [Neptunomonas qingdaonensis]SFG64169.1 nicotinate-nucleotide pyrophosphorylase [carboxylating] [Neptunomonas qingdaonensis]
MLTITDLKPVIHANVTAALTEDVGSGDITALLICETEQATARVISRESAVISGTAWVDEVFRQVDSNMQIQWQIKDGDRVKPDQVLFTAKGSARSLLTAERCALNFLQTLSGTATISQHYADKVASTSVRLLDTRKTIPGLRMAQKYAVTCGGCYNHRIGLYDAFLIKENHIMACGGIKQAIETAQKTAPGKKVEVEVETLAQLQQALDAHADIIMLDNFAPEELREAVAINKALANSAQAKLEASGNITEDTLLNIAQTGVDYISIGALTKHCRAIDLSMRLI